MLLVIFFLGIIKMFCMYQGKHNFQKKKHTNSLII